MRALLMKDCFVLWKQLRLYVVLMLIFTVFNGAFGNVFIVIWAAMLPYTAMAYDERSKWDQMAAMMPYSIRDIVLSKYLLGWVCSVAAGLCSMALQFVLHGCSSFLLYRVLGTPDCTKACNQAKNPSGSSPACHECPPCLIP